MATEKKKVKKLLRVEAYPGSSTSGYGNTTMMFSLVNIIGGDRKQVLSAYTCREQFCAGIKNVIQNGGNHGLTLDLDRVRLLIIQDPSDFKVFRDKLFTGKRLANIFEEAAGWKPLGKITTVKHSAYKNAWLYTGPGEWMSQPQLMSTLTFLLRMASAHGPFDASNVQEAEAAMKKLLKATSGKTADTSSFLPHIWDSLKLVTKEHRKIFGKPDPKKAWDDPQGSSFGYASGILNFVTGSPDYSSHVIAAQRRFKELRKKS